MQIGMIGLGRMGANMVRRLMNKGHACVVYDRSPVAVGKLEQTGASGVADLDALIAALQPPRVIWLMLPAGVVGGLLESLSGRLDSGDILIDGGNSHYKDDIVRARRLQARGIHYLDVGTSGGVWGLERGYCLMIGGDAAAVERVTPIFQALAPGDQGAYPTRRNTDLTPAEQGWLHCGPAGSGHFVKMVHNGIEYGIMAAYAEGLNILHHADVGRMEQGEDAETAPLEDPQDFQYEIPVAQVAEVWRHGSVIGSWLLDLTAQALRNDPRLAGFHGRVADSGEGRWSAIAAVESGVPAPVISAALFSRFSSRDEDDFADRVLSAMRYGFGGHREKMGQQIE